MQVTTAREPKQYATQPHTVGYADKQHDTTILGPNTEVHILMQFRTFEGPFVFHCHNLDHEDMRMMFNMDPRLLPTESPQQTQNLFP